ncbi:E3 ubiquitin/ISG15 ligase TRIM25-like [Bombina bombina]|uniref:E3 ubiquitin/ISG15 ligase TRIM25-like n=1 Tax=Bombina bombina TaxID=8345 RepID=UPI00235ADA00|nr:E3 ubiquitin/ISG15 ligase TRIM25-like [Bombina bombina]
MLLELGNLQPYKVNSQEFTVTAICTPHPVLNTFHYNFLLQYTSMASAELREEITCPICLSIYTAPVTLSCGHTYCLSCINKTRDNQEEYSCPECKHKLRRPERKRNLRLRNIAENFQPTKPVRKTGIFCTFCIHSPVPAAKSCLLCEASLCDTHLRVHSKSEEHVLTEPTTSWVNRKCSIHKELLKYYCTEEDACICVSCFLAGEHRGHQVELLNEASEKKKKKLRNVLQKLTTKREKTEKRVQSLQEHMRGVQEKAAGVTERLTALIRDIRKQLEDLEKQVLSDITRQQEQVLLTISDLIQQLEKEKEEMTRKISHIEELYNMTDPLTVLQEQESHRDDFCGAEKGDNEVTQRGDKQVPAGGDLDEDLISVTLYRGLADIVTDVKRGLYMQVTSDILLDINTAGNRNTGTIIVRPPPFSEGELVCLVYGMDKYFPKRIGGLCGVAHEDRNKIVYEMLKQMYRISDGQLLGEDPAPAFSPALAEDEAAGGEPRDQGTQTEHFLQDLFQQLVERLQIVATAVRGLQEAIRNVF